MSLNINGYTFCSIIIGIVTLALFATRRWFNHDPREPPLASQSIPFIGHLVGLWQNKFNYYLTLKYALRERREE